MSISQFTLGLVMGIGGTVFCVALGFLGSVLGHYSGERYIARVRVEVDEAHGDVPTPPYGIAADDADQTWGR